MKKYGVILFLGFLSLPSCQTFTSHEKAVRPFELQGHRGARGVFPENSITGFIKAINMEVNTLEMDVVISGDGQVVVSHEPFLSPEICLDGSEELNMYQMSYDEIASYDCGSKPHPRFLDQQNVQVVKPLLSKVIDSVETYLLSRNLAPVNYNIEIKSTRETDGVFHPAPGEFSDLVYRVIDSRLEWRRVTIQAFDFRVLEYFHNIYPDVRLVLLIENDMGFQVNLDSLGFKPAVYSCHFPLLSQKDVSKLQGKGMMVIPWTVNEISDMKRLIEWGVDGLITDYPNKYQTIVNEQ